MKNLLTTIILTKDEKVHSERCLKNVSGLTSEVFIVDSGSSDKTVEIAEKYGAKVFKHEFENQAQQFNWALDNLPITGEWVLRLDADEYLTEELKKEIEGVLKTNSTVDGFYIKRKVIFMGRWIRHGGFYPTRLLRLFRKGKGRCQEKEMDEHILVSGQTAELEYDIVDENKKGIGFFIEKHNKYAQREARDILSGVTQKESKQAYLQWPKFLRAFVYFFYRYFILLGFLDGIEGFIFHVLQGFWYRFLVDVKLYELERTYDKS